MGRHADPWRSREPGSWRDAVRETSGPRIDHDAHEGFGIRGPSTPLWAIEGDIKGCFDNIDHHGLMCRVRLRVGDAKVTRLVVAFLKSGIMSEEQFSRTDAGTPQGGIFSPLLANIALGLIDERYERYVWPRREPRPLSAREDILARAARNRCNDRRSRNLRRTVFVPVRYADDFIILVGAPEGPRRMARAEEAEHQEKAALADSLRTTLGLELSEAKTLVTRVTKPMRFLGHRELRVNVDGEPGAERKLHAGFGRGHVETDR